MYSTYRSSNEIEFIQVRYASLLVNLLYNNNKILQIILQQSNLIALNKSHESNLRKQRMFQFGSNWSMFRFDSY